MKPQPSAILLRSARGASDGTCQREESPRKSAKRAPDAPQCRKGPFMETRRRNWTKTTESTRCAKSETNWLSAKSTRK